MAIVIGILIGLAAGLVVALVALRYLQGSKLAAAD